MIYNNVLEAVGNTPMIRLNRMVDEDCAEILVKFEAVNVGGSIKTRTALNMIMDAEEKGIIKEDTIIVEPTSGNQGIGLALVGAVRGYKTVIIMPDSVSEERRKLVKQYGADIRVVHDEGDIGKCINDCIQMGIGDGVIPGILDQKIYDEIVIVTDEEALQTARELARKEGLLCGISSGTNVAAAMKLARKLGKGKTVVTVLPDTAERYYSTPLFEG